MDLNHISVFLRVVEAESFTAAAAALGLPKSSVSRSVAKLEEELGVRLLQRTTRKLNLTDAGRAYFDRARAAMTGLDDAGTAVRDMGKHARGTVRVSAPVDVGVIALADIVARFVRRYPQIHVDLSLTGRLVDLVEEGFDLAVRAGKLESSSLIARKIGSTELALYAAHGYVRRRGRPRSLGDLAEHDCVLFRGHAGKATWQLTGPNGEEKIEVTGPINVDEMSFVRSAVIAGLGIGLVPIFLCPNEVEKNELVRVLPEYSHRAGALYVVSPPIRYEPARVTLFREFLVTSLAATFHEQRAERAPATRAAARGSEATAT